MALKTFRPLTPVQRHQAAARFRRDHEVQAREVAPRSPQADRRPQQQRPHDLAPHRRRPQAEVSRRRFQAPQARHRRRRDRHRVRSDPHRALGAAPVRGRREDVHHRPERLAGRREGRFRPRRRARTWQLAAAQEHSAGHQHSQRGTDPRPRRPDRPQRRPAGRPEQSRGRLRAGEDALRAKSAASTRTLMRPSARSATSTT